MSFWIASPSNDPEAFLLSVAAIGWELAVWRLVSRCVLVLYVSFALVGAIVLRYSYILATGPF
jgi:uncharacterized membrane protein YraQ (UPF0718 family)